MSAKTTSTRLTCPRCGRSGFYGMGLRVHVCRGVRPNDERRRLNQDELKEAAAAAAREIAADCGRGNPDCLRQPKPMLRLNYGINRKEGRKIVHRNHSMKLRGTMDDSDLLKRVIAHVSRRHPGWRLTGYARAQAEEPPRFFWKRCYGIGGETHWALCDTESEKRGMVSCSLLVLLATDTEKLGEEFLPALIVRLLNEHYAKGTRT